MSDQVDKRVLELVNEMLRDGANSRRIYLYQEDIKRFQLPNGHIVTMSIRIEKNHDMGNVKPYDYKGE